MDGKGRVGVRSWDFSGQPRKAGPVPKPTSDVFSHHGAVSDQLVGFLRTSSGPGRHPLTETNFEVAPMDFGWIPQRNFLPTTKSDLNCVPTSQVNPETSAVPAVPLAQNDSLVKATKAKKQPSSTKKPNHVASKVLQPKQPKKQKQPSGSTKKKSGSVSTGKREKRSTDIALQGITFDFSGVPAPVCSCTGVPRQCYRWGAAGWQSSCCTTAISEYPLPMSPSRPGARLPGRKMSISAYGKLLQRLAVEGYDLSIPVDLKTHWARHGTNKFVTIK